MEEKECRVCREGEEDNHPLYAPCLCNGSILYCHQDCLEEWLKHSGKDKCELCGMVYSFSPKYSPDMPDAIPIERFVSGSINAIVKRIFPLLLRVLVALLSWLCVVPYITGSMYYQFVSSATVSYSIFDGIVTGTLLTGLVAVTFIVLMSFADFLRAYWANHHHPPRHRERGNDGNAAAPRNRMEMGQAEIPNALDIQRNLDELDRIMREQLVENNVANEINAAGVNAEDGVGRVFAQLAQEQAEQHQQMRQAIVNLDEALRQHREQAQIDIGNNPAAAVGAPVPAVDHENVVEEEEGWSDDSSMETSSEGDDNQAEFPGGGNDPDNAEHNARAIDAQPVGELLDNGLDPELDLPPIVDEDVPDDEDLLDILDDNFVDERFDLDVVEGNEILPAGNIPAVPGDGIDARNGAGVAAGAGNGVGGNGADGGPGAGRRRRRQGGAEVELHLNIGEIIGIRGTVMTVLKYVYWVVIFNLCCTLVGMFIPTVLGKFALYLTRRFFSFPLLWATAQLEPLVSYVAIDVSGLGALLMQPTNQSKLLRLPDLLVIGTGVTFLGVLIIALNGFRALVLQFMKFDTRAIVPGSWHFVLTVIGALGEILKIGCMLGFRVFCLPCIIGTLVMLFCNTFLQASLQSAVEWAGNHIIGALAILWGSGIAYMLFATIAILQLREILHPDLLAKYIRPQESQSDLLLSLLMDPVFTQIKRLIASFGVYFCMSVVFIYIPIQIASLLLPWACPLQLYFWYLAAEVQVPFEVGFIHTVYLTMLEKHKNKIGYVLHYGLLRLTKFVGVDRYLLPFSMKVIESEEHRERARKLNREIITLIDGSTAVVGQPMLRPPKGWDARTRNSANRWSWSHDETTALEKAVAPRSRPSGLYLKLFVVAGVSWASVVLTAWCLLATPLILGRGIVWLLLVPTNRWHDPLNIVLGVVFSQVLLKGVAVGKELFFLLKKHLHLFDRRVMELCVYMSSVCFLAIPFSVGVFLSILLRTIPYWAVPTLIHQELFKTFLLGLVAVMWTTVMILSGSVDRILVRLGYRPKFESVLLSVMGVMEGLQNAVHHESNYLRDNWDTDRLLEMLQTFHDSVIAPIVRPVTLVSVPLALVAVCDISSLLGWHPIATSFSLASRRITCTHFYVYLTMIVIMSQHMRSWCKFWYDKFYQSVKDENYLIGLELQNSEEGKRHMQQEYSPLN